MTTPEPRAPLSTDDLTWLRESYVTGVVQPDKTVERLLDELERCRALLDGITSWDSARRHDATVKALAYLRAAEGGSGEPRENAVAHRVQWVISATRVRNEHRTREKRHLPSRSVWRGASQSD